MQDFPWYRFVYICSPLKVPASGMKRVYGFDSEAYTTGEPFLFCLSSGDTFSPSSFLQEIFTRQYRNSNFICYNLKYESGALLYHLPESVKRTLYEEEKAEWDGMRIYMIGYKHLRFTRGSNSVSFWDVSPFYRMRLGDAAVKYLGEKKIVEDVTRYTPDSVKDRMKEIISYCRKDAEITEGLYRLVENRFAKFGVYFKKLYSPAYVSFKYFVKHSDIVTLDDFLPENPRCVKYATYAFHGGKFEMTARGKGDFWEYDINAAYPNEIRNLLDIRGAKVVNSLEYVKEAQYAFLHVRFKHLDDIHHPVPIRLNGPYIYPIGEYSAYITKAEYDFLVRHGVKVDILDAEWIIVKEKKYPYREVIDKLYYERAKYKGKDEAVYSLFKVIMNSFYGKMVQKPMEGKRFYKVYSGWNTVYGAIITANVRCRISEMQQTHRDNIIAVHTDSIISRVPISGLNGSKEIGDFSFTTKGMGVMIQCGFYQIGDKVKTQSFETEKGISLFDVLKWNRRKDTIDFEVVRPRSFKDTVRRGDFENLNRFLKEIKGRNINKDSKRVWLRDVTCGDLLKDIYLSCPRIHYGS